MFKQVGGEIFTAFFYCPFQKLILDLPPSLNNRTKCLVTESRLPLAPPSQPRANVGFNFYVRGTCTLLILNSIFRI